jgi:AraC-like DNA-binding protein
MSDPDFSVAQFASRMNMSRSNLNIRIKAVTGSAPLDLMRKHRFNEACRLLKEGNLTIAQISDRTGFSSPSYFTTSFRSQFGCTPSDFQSKK